MNERALTFLRLWSKLLVLCLVMSFSACAWLSAKKPPVRPEGKVPEGSYEVFGQSYSPLKTADGFSQIGVASWYGSDFHGRRTSNGEDYNMFSMTAAHTILPFDTVVLVRNLESGKEAKVRINDRGPFVKGRVIDLSFRAAKEIGVVGPGTARVQVLALGKEKTVTKGGMTTTIYEPAADYGIGTFFIQVGSFTVRKNAEQLVSKLKDSYGDAHIVEYDRGDQLFYQVRVAKAGTLTGAKEKARQLKQVGFEDSFIVSD
ncbi:MAG: septal ring lytic transglycosylase RlpA family protein [Deltaproteobacteria bacterium]|nr:septal ring lytic transglycosylase RlpA family protein [Deltaproteobacteria bacterium]